MNKQHFHEIDSIINPSGVAIIGASPVADIATWAHIDKKINDRLYLVNPKYCEILGKKCYPSVLDIEAPVDFAIISINAAMVPAVIEQCVQKGIKAVHIYTAGFSETGLPEGIALEQKLKEAARGRIRIIGPNCFGIYCPKSGLAIVPESTEEEGSVGVIAQSGSVAESFAYFGQTKNLRFSKVISYGNAVDLDGPDFLEYLAEDPDTRVIALYIEGEKNGKRLREALSYAASKKPVIAIKGGLSESGNRVARSHTGQLTGTPQVWRTLFRQCGAVQVSNFDDMMNTVIAFSHPPLPRGKRVAMITNSGGFGVIQTDLCASEGLDVPRFSDETLTRLRKLVPVAGTAIGNPLDAWPIFYRIFEKDGSLADIIRIVAEDKNTDSLVFLFDQFRYLRRARKQEVAGHMQTVIGMMLEGANYCRDVLKKPVFLCVILDPYSEDDEDRKYNLLLRNAFAGAGFPVYPTLHDGVKSLAKLYVYARAKGLAE